MNSSHTQRMNVVSVVYLFIRVCISSFSTAGCVVFLHIRSLPLKAKDAKINKKPKRS